MSNIGEPLKTARNNKAFTLEEVHAKIKIHPRVLQLIEEEKFDKLPSPVFAKSFIKSYAEFLELNAEDLVAAYEKHTGALAPAEQTLIIPSASDRQKSSFFNRNFFLITGVVLAVVVGAFILQDISKTVARRSGKQIKTSKNTRAGVKSAPKNETPKAPEATADWLRSPELGNFPKISAKAQLHLTIKALDPVWVRVTCDGKVLFESILKKGMAESWDADNRIELWTGNASKMALTLNEFFLGSPGKGVVKRMAITHEGVRVAS